MMIHEFALYCQKCHTPIEIVQFTAGGLPIESTAYIFNGGKRKGNCPNCGEYYDLRKHPVEEIKRDYFE